MNNEFLHIEGLDLSGKSTLVKTIIENSKLYWLVRNKKLTNINPIFDFVTKIQKEGQYSLDVIGNMCLGALWADIDNYLVEEKNIIQDSTMALRSLAYYAARGYTKIANGFEAALDKHPKPTHSFCLSASLDTRLKRLDKRFKENGQISKLDLEIINNPKLFMKTDKIIQDAAIKYFNSKIIDTSNLSEYDIFEIVRNDVGLE